jgi:hypothetical protein
LGLAERSAPPAGRAAVALYAALYELREYGISQLAKPNCQRRLAVLSPKQFEELIAALLRLQPYYQTITDELIATLQEIL